MEEELDIFQLLNDLIAHECEHFGRQSKKVQELEQAKEELKKLYTKDPEVFLKAQDMYREENNIWPEAGPTGMVYSTSSVPNIIVIQDLSTGASALMFFLSLHYTTQRFTASKQEICAVGHMSRKTADKYMRELINAGIIHEMRNHGSNAPAECSWNYAFFQFDRANFGQMKKDVQELRLRAGKKKPRVLTEIKCLPVNGKMEMVTVFKIND